MQKQNIQTLKGFRDFMPSEKKARDFVVKKIIGVFEKYGFEPLETPTLEYASLLLGKYGDEADKLVYKFEDRGGREIALRYDQTVPTARFLAAYQGQLPKFFRRYQMQNVFRADKPQKGRFREFTQCDIDIFGSKSYLSDSEILACVYDVFTSIGFSNVKIKINDREVLFNSIRELIPEGKIERFTSFSIIQSIDKLDKVGEKGVVEELVNKGLEENVAREVLVRIKGARISENLEKIRKSAIGLGVREESLEFVPTLARGLDYYTGMIFEIRIDGYEVGSLGGGGRYDNLIENLSGLVMPAVGVGLGFDRICEAAKQFNLIPDFGSQAQVLITVFNDELKDKSLEVVKILRKNGIKCEVYPEIGELGKQFKLANNKKIKYVVVIGEEEVAENKVTLKNMENGEQKKIGIEEVVKLLS